MSQLRKAPIRLYPRTTLAQMEERRKRLAAMTADERERYEDLKREADNERQYERDEE